jgi:predicted  nucleic acid-binding Zn-ribbon protein
MGRSPRGGRAGSRLIPRIVRYSLAVSGHPLAANLFLCLMENEIAATIGESLQQLSLSRQSERGDIGGQLMAVSTTVLRELHRLHSQLSDLRERLDRGPSRVQAHETNVARQQAALASARENVQQTKKIVDSKQLDLGTGENKILDLKAKLNGCGSNKEYQMLLEQIAASEMANSVRADEILEAMEKVDQLEVSVAEQKALLSTAEKELVSCRDAVAAEASVIEGDIGRLEGELTAADQGLPADFKIDYRRVIQAKGADGMAEAEDGVCQGCGYQITLNMQTELMLSKPIFCKACGCLLYMAAAESDVGG